MWCCTYILVVFVYDLNLFDRKPVGIAFASPLWNWFRLFGFISWNLENKRHYLLRLLCYYFLLFFLALGWKLISFSMLSLFCSEARLLHILAENNEIFIISDSRTTGRMVSCSEGIWHFVELPPLPWSNWRKTCKHQLTVKVNIIIRFFLYCIYSLLLMQNITFCM